ncbi:demethylmenaquinone methyltransferase [Actinoplanes sp. NPDC024001]|uniref:demethylmenaquinone methyltransferase n=1 Tax=Actinoplanes sp. NPDC024001 TaxID=3154598 RepID=UPI00341061E0
MTRAHLDKQPHEIAAMFDGVAERYDVTNRVISFGRDRGWRRLTRQALGLRPGERVLDVGAGTGVSTEELARSGAYAVGVDLSVGMLRAGRRAGQAVPLLAGDALRLPFPDASFDAVTISFALRNVVDVDAALREFARVTRPGGRLVVCECSRPVNPVFRAVYLSGVLRAMPVLARWVASNPEAYVYLVESIRAWPGQEELAARLAAAGWRRVAWRNLAGGAAALHRAVR